MFHATSRWSRINLGELLIDDLAERRLVAARAATMGSDLVGDTEIILSARWKYALALLGGLALTGGSILFAQVAGRGERWLGYASLGLWIPGSLVLALQLLFPPRLLLDRHGLEVIGFRPWRRTLRWHDVESFFVFQPPMNKDAPRYVGYRLRADLAPSGWARAWRPFGSDGELPPNWSLPPERLADLLNMRRAEALGVQADSPIATLTHPQETQT